MRCRGLACLRAEPRSAGFALLIVLWTLVLIAFLVLHLTASGRTEMRIASNLQSNAVAAAAADGGISAAVFNLTAPQPEARWPVPGPPHQMTIGDCRVMVTIENEAARINPNLASPILLEALLRAIGLDPDNAQRVAAAIAEWVGSSPTPKTADMLKAEYQSAGLDYAPPAAPVETIDEISRVLGVTPAIYAAMRPHLTLFGPAQPDPAGGDPVVAAALSQIPQEAQAATPVATTLQDSLTLRIVAQAVGPGNAQASRTAVVRVDPSLPQSYAVLAWHNTAD
jgi:general secretion pathway protein K